MAYIQTIPEQEATGEVLAMYKRQSKPYGYLPNYAKVYCYRPELMTAWAGLQKCIKQNLDDKTYSLVSFAAAIAIDASSCALAFGNKLHEKHFDSAQLVAISEGDYSTLNRKDAVIVAFAIKVALHSAKVRNKDVQSLRSVGLKDEAIFDIVSAVAARCFFAKSVDALGAGPDAPFRELQNRLGLSLVHGREIDATSADTTHS